MRSCRGATPFSAERANFRAESIAVAFLGERVRGGGRDNLTIIEERNIIIPTMDFARCDRVTRFPTIIARARCSWLTVGFLRPDNS